MTNITKDTQFRVIGTENKSPLVYIDEVAEYINAGGVDGQPTVTVNDITDATTVGKDILLASTQVQARTAIGAGTSNLTIGTTATTAKAGDYAPPNASTTVDGLMLSADKVKLDGVATGATKNQSDVNLLNRANHTGTQPISSITGVVPIAQIPTGSTAATVASGNHIHDAATIAVAGFMLSADKVKLDGVATGATKNQSDVILLNRTNHTGTQPISSITGVVPIAQIPTGSTATTVALGNHTHAVATTTVAGFMSGVDKTKLDNLKGVILATRPTITITDPPNAANIRASFNTILNYIDAIIGR